MAKNNDALVTAVLGEDFVRETNRRAATRATTRETVAVSSAKVRVTNRYAVEWCDANYFNPRRCDGFETRKDARLFARGVKSAGGMDVFIVTREVV